MSRLIALLAVAALTLAACGEPARSTTAPAPQAITDNTRCSQTGLRLADHAGPKGQLWLAGRDAPEFHVDTVQMFHFLLLPDPGRSVLGAFVQDMTGQDWHAPDGAWIDARSAWYVHGTTPIGPMGPTLVSFAQRAEAEAFAARHGGELLRFADIDPDRVPLDGGALHDASM